MLMLLVVVVVEESYPGSRVHAVAAAWHLAAFQIAADITESAAALSHSVCSGS